LRAEAVGLTGHFTRIHRPGDSSAVESGAASRKEADDPARRIRCPQRSEKYGLPVSGPEARQGRRRRGRDRAAMIRLGILICRILLQ